MTCTHASTMGEHVKLEANSGPGWAAKLVEPPEVRDIEFISVRIEGGETIIHDGRIVDK